MAKGKPAGIYATDDTAGLRYGSYGQLVGYNDNVLVYALGDGSTDRETAAYGSGWRYQRFNGAIGAIADDLGTWGEVVRVSNIESSVLEVNSAAHTVTVKAAVTDIGSQADFVKTALHMMLNQGGSYDCLLFAGEKGRSALLAESLSLTADISLAGTGINGFMRDGSETISDSNPGGVGTFKGTLNGQNHTLTLAIGETYGIYGNEQTEGMGQIYRHRYNGLFAVIGDGTTAGTTVQKLTVAGTIVVRNAGKDGMTIGGVAARSHGSVTFTDIRSNVEVSYHEGKNSPATENLGKNIGGLIGYVDNNTASKDNGTITIDGTSFIGASFQLTGHHENLNVYGGAIGKIAAEKFIVNIAQDDSDKLTVGMTADISGITNPGDHSYSGGLIGYILAKGANGKDGYDNRQVNINRLYFDGCTIGNAAKSTGGGFLGYAWLNTKATIDGLTLKTGTDNTINNTAGKTTAGNVGVMCYSATGVWRVNSLTVNKLTMNNGGGTSLGMIVNRAYSGNNGLYLDVLKNGYTLTSAGITLPTSLDIYDELAAYSASSVIDGGNGAGVVSVNMNSDRNETETKITVTGTYQNQLGSASSAALDENAKCSNANARYYYNLDQMSSSDGGQNLLLWSVNKYAPSNIRAEFTSTLDKTLGGTADLTGLSFYPLASANANYTIGDLTLTFDYSNIYDTAETINNTDSYIRDPGAANQHYLMHSGLFINQPYGNTLAISGKLALEGTFLEDDSHQGVIFSGTMKGNFTSGDSSEIKLDGIKPMQAENKAYSDGYLLINAIKRDPSVSAKAPSVMIKNLYTTNKYSTPSYQANGTTDTVAKSLIGEASGKELSIVFSHIKLDARDRKSTDTKLSEKAEALYNAYGTYNSIFKESTLLASIYTDQNATLEYNYTRDEDWGDGTPRYVTYGKEVKASVEYAGKEDKYYGDVRKYTNPVSDSNDVYDFSTGFLPYVCGAYDKTQDVNGCFKRELKVNVMTAGLTQGCGTYNDPYIIADAEVLESVANFILNGNTSALTQVNLPKKYSDFDSLSENTRGSRWCESKSGHALYIPNAGGTGYKAKDSSDSDAKEWKAKVNVQYYLANAYYKIGDNIELSDTFVGLGGTTANTAFRGVIVGEKNQDGTPKYTITNKSTAPFINVSNGSVVKDLNIVVAAGKISLSQTTNTYRDAYFDYNSKCAYYGGIIGEIMGGDNIIDNSYVSFAYTDSEGENQKTSITLNDSYSTICPVGSYVGVIVFGGLVFKNMNDTTANTNAATMEVKYKKNKALQDANLADNSKQAAWAAIYVNPIVGRVINGYAVNETTRFSVTEDGKYHDENGTTRTGAVHLLKNGTKHYAIADINKDETNKLSVTPPTSASDDGTITIPNSQAFFILSLITQSCAGTAQTAGGEYKNSLSYGTNTTVYGMSHNADYKDVGTNETSSSDYTDYASRDTAANTAVPYIIRRYTTADSGNYPARCVTSTLGYYDINLTGSSYVLPDSFRGLGSVGNYDTKNCGEENSNPKGTNITTNHAKYSERVENNFCIKLDVFSGNEAVIDEDIYLNKYQTDNYFNRLHNGTSQSILDTQVEYKPNSNTLNHGIGLFDSIILRDTDSKISNFTITGSVNTEIYNNTYKDEKTGQLIKGIAGDNYWLSVGGVLGWATNATCLTFDKIQLNKLTVSGSSTVGGILGFSGLSSTTLNVVVSECSAENISVEMTSAMVNESGEKARNGIGCLVGKVKEAAVIIYGAGISSGEEVEDTGSAKVSEVKIKSFKFGDNTADYTVSAGGLVGFAGNGCRAYDMKVSPYNNANVTVGGTKNKIRYVGGIVGLMQPTNANEKTCLAVFKNCTIEQINIEGIYAGGLYGGKWNGTGYSPYRIDIENCKILGKSTTEKNTITANNYAGGLVGWGIVQTREGNVANISIKDSVVSNYTISASSSGRSGGFVGVCQAQSASITCYIQDSSVENCTIGSTNNDFAGGIIGGITKHNDNKIIGYNIKLDNVTSESSNIGAWIGNVVSDDNNTSIQFTGMAVYGNGFTKNVGNRANFSNASFVFADYTGQSKTDTTAYASAYNTTANVDMPRYPYVNTNPQASMGTNEIISGDGAVLYSGIVSDYSEGTAGKTMAAKIYKDISDGVGSRRYTTFSDSDIVASKTIDYYLTRTVDDDGDRISTYATERGRTPSGVDDFAVVVIANTNDTETTNLINRYIQLVTNTTTDYTKTSDYYSMSIGTCRYNDTDPETAKFELITDENDADYAPGLTFADGQFALDRTHADSRKANTFTLLDVQFKDPFDTEKIAYHLYVPVYTIKQMTYDFHTAVVTGTNSVSYTASGAVKTSDYETLLSQNDTHIDSLKTWITQYIRFTYEKEDINNLLASGNLKWNLEKTMSYNTQANSYKLPDDTYMMLVDPNGNADKMYYTSASAFTSIDDGNGGWKIDFSNFRDSSNQAFTAGYFSDILSRSLTRAEAEGKGSYSRIQQEGNSVPESYDLCYVNNGTKEYYEFVAGGGGDYNFSVNADINEDYYLSFWVPVPSEYKYELFYFTVVPEDTLPGRRTAKLDQANTVNMLIAELYAQDTSVWYEVSPNEQEINESNHEITVTAATTIRLTNANANPYLSDANLYHAFHLVLNRYENGGSVSSEIYDLPSSGITAKYGVTGNTYSSAMEPTENASAELSGSYLNIKTTDIMSSLRNDSDHTITIYATVSMEFNPLELEQEFPERGTGAENVGVNVAARSNLAYDQSRLAYTSMTEPFREDQHYYYIETANTAMLNYYATDELDAYDPDGSQSRNMSRLGINGRTSSKNWMPVNSEADYNVGILDNWEEGDKIRLTLMVNKKTDVFDEQDATKVIGAEYVQVEDIAKYLNTDADVADVGVIEIKSGETAFTKVEDSSSPDKYVYEAKCESCDFEDGYYHFNIAFDVKTGEGFTEYANYQVYLQAELIDEDSQTVENSRVRDYIVYTNAKVVSEVINAD